MIQESEKKENEFDVLIPEGAENLYCILIFIAVTILFTSFFILIWGMEILKQGISLFIHNKIHFLLTTVLGIIAHEALHGITWAAYCKNGFRSINQMEIPDSLCALYRAFENKTI
jgi:hypothetical protein